MNRIFIVLCIVLAVAVIGNFALYNRIGSLEDDIARLTLQAYAGVGK